jgi:hypothetical protein
MEHSYNQRQYNLDRTLLFDKKRYIQCSTYDETTYDKWLIALNTLLKYPFLLIIIYKLLINVRKVKTRL